MSARNRRQKGASAVAVAVALTLVVPTLLVLAGCGGNTPEGAVQNFFNAWQSLNWEAYKNAVNPGQKLTKNQEELAKLKFKQIKVKFQVPQDALEDRPQGPEQGDGHTGGRKDNVYRGYPRKTADEYSGYFQTKRQAYLRCCQNKRRVVRGIPARVDRINAK